MNTNLPIQIKSFDLLEEQKSFQLFQLQDRKPKNIWEANGMNNPGGGGFGTFLWSLLWLIPILGIAFFISRQKF
ncbi:MULTISPECIES: hypothetical protein [Aerosakkonema]|uniref:hypothetical protein n=1 Tax=Aerosakkonema TaxID=1246629 RepID=UPI0035BC176C